MITFREWLKNKNLREDAPFTNPVNIQQAIAGALNPPPPQTTVNPNLIAAQFVQKAGNPLKQAIANTPQMKQLAAASLAKTVGKNGQTNSTTPGISTTIPPSTVSLPMQPGGLNFNY